MTRFSDAAAIKEVSAAATASTALRVYRHAGAPRPLAQTDFLVVAPDNAQVNLIRSELE